MDSQVACLPLLARLKGLYSFSNWLSATSILNNPLTRYSTLQENHPGAWQKSAHTTAAMNNSQVSQPQFKSLQTNTQAELLDVIDNLRNQGISRYVSLPQLIVCGDQSSGKSSVLEAVSRVSFPTNDGLCTRFATEVILRRSARKSASVRIIPAADTAPELKEEFEAFVKPHVALEEIPELVAEAKVKMGLTGNSTFSRNILQLEISDPDLPHLTLVDLPGLIHHPNRDQSDDDVEIPKDLVRSYMKSPRSIVLAIVSAKNDTSNQIVLKFAKEIDPQGRRTMGIITKPDSLPEGSPNESSFFELAKNQDTSFKLGWHMLRNADYSEKKDPQFNRDQAEEQFFSKPPWNGLPKTNVGVKTLRTRLSKVLLQQISNELPSVVKEIEHQLEGCRDALTRLGPPRDTSAKQRVYLTTISERFQSLVRAAVAGDYQDPFFRIEDETFGRRLRAELRHLTKEFAAVMEGRGHTYEIVERLFPASDSHVPSKTRHKLVQETQLLLNQSKGRELPGTYLPLLVGDLFMTQSRKWEGMADAHVHDAWEAVRLFLDYVLKHIAEPNTREAILQDIIDPAMELKLECLSEKVKELMTPYNGGFPSTLNRKFVADIERMRSARAKEVQEDVLQGVDMEYHACSELVDCMQAYYQIALDVFVDNIASLAIENCLMKGLNGILSPSRVAEMTDKELERLVAEPEDIQLVRDQTTAKKKELEAGLQVCRQQERRMAASHRDAPSSSNANNPRPKFASPSSKSNPNPSSAPDIKIAKKPEGKNSSKDSSKPQQDEITTFPRSAFGQPTTPSKTAKKPEGENSSKDSSKLQQDEVTTFPQSAFGQPNNPSKTTPFLGSTGTANTAAPSSSSSLFSSPTPTLFGTWKHDPISSGGGLGGGFGAPKCKSVNYITHDKG